MSQRDEASREEGSDTGDVLLQHPPLMPQANRSIQRFGGEERYDQSGNLRRVTW